MRANYTFLVIPMLDPDAAASGNHQGIISSFWIGRRTAESISYANWFQHWIDSGHRVDLVLDLHNVQSKECPNVACALMERLGVRGAASRALHSMILGQVQTAGYFASMAPRQYGWSPDRLGGWLSHSYGSLTLAYEVNAQASERHLNLEQLKRLGVPFVIAATALLSGPDGRSILADIDSTLQKRAELRTQVDVATAQDAIEAEAKIAGGPISAKSTDEKWIY
jgi:hypothetical protein